MTAVMHQAETELRQALERAVTSARTAERLAMASAAPPRHCADLMVARELLERVSAASA